MSEASFTVAIAARTSVDALRKCCSDTVASAAGTENRRMPSRTTTSPSGGMRVAHVEERRAVRQRRRLVAALRRAHEQLRRHRAVAALQGERLLGREAPLVAEARRRDSWRRNPRTTHTRRCCRRAPRRGARGCTSP